MRNYRNTVRPPSIFLLSFLVLASCAGCRKEVVPLKSLLKETFLSQPRPSFYYWNRVLSFPRAEADSLASGCPLFIKVCEIDVGADHEIRLHGGLQKGAGPFPSGSPVLAVYRGNHSLAINLKSLDAERLVSAVMDSFYAWKENFQAVGLKPIGIQLDIDAPADQLRYYKNLLMLLRARLPKEDLCSITALPVWLHYGEFAHVARTVDFFVPQFYTNVVKKQISRGPFILTDLAWDKDLEAADRIGAPYLVGLPTFGAIFHYNPKGELVALIYHDFSVDDLIANRYVKLEDKWSADTEEVALFRCLASTREGRIHFGTGDSIVIVRQNVEGLYKVRRRIKSLPLKNILGVVWYRLKENDERLVLSAHEILTMEERVKEKTWP